MVGIEREARRLYALAWPGRAWPDGWIVRWVDDLPGMCGLTNFTDKHIFICRRAAKDNEPSHLHDTIVHELTHMVHPTLPHGRAFSARVRWAKQRTLDLSSKFV